MYTDEDYEYQQEMYILTSEDLDYNPIQYSNPLSNKDYNIIKRSDLHKLRNSLIEECEEFTCLSRNEAILVLVQYQWNIETIKDFWYNDPELNRKRCGIDLSEDSLNLLSKQNIHNESFCSICFTSKEDMQEGTEFFNLKCGHIFCTDCWKEYLSNRLEDILNIMYTTCPQSGCSLIITEDIFEKFLKDSSDDYNQTLTNNNHIPLLYRISSEGLSQNKLSECRSKYKLYLKGVFLNFTDRNKDLRWCPSPYCDICIQCTSHQKEIECECNTVFCFTCCKEGHRPCTCEMIDIWEKKNKSESENVKWLTANAKQCPNCQKYIEKNQGCNHMICPKHLQGCGYQFCWVCLGDWKPHGSSWYQCNRFDPEKLKKEQDSTSNAKNELAKYVHYFDRYMNHDNAMKLAEKMKNEINTYIKDFNKHHEMPYEELRFMENAVETIIKSRRRLKYTYVFGYYLKDLPEKDLFEHHQNILEKEADLLHEYMENETIDKLLKIKDFSKFNFEFNNFKANITNLEAATTKYQNNLISDIELKMSNLVDYKSLK